MSNPTWDDIKDAVGCTYRQYDHWSTKGYIHTLDNHPSSGFPRTLLRSEVDVLTILADLVTAGLTPAAAAPLARALAVNESVPLGSFRVYHVAAAA